MASPSCALGGTHRESRRWPHPVVDPAGYLKAHHSGGRTRCLTVRVPTHGQAVHPLRQIWLEVLAVQSAVDGCRSLQTASPLVDRGRSVEGEGVPRLVEALEAVLTTVAEMRVAAEQDVAHSWRDEDAAVVRRLLDSGGEVDRRADDVAVLSDPLSGSTKTVSQPAVAPSRLAEPIRSGPHLALPERSLRERKARGARRSRPCRRREHQPAPGRGCFIVRRPPPRRGGRRDPGRDLADAALFGDSARGSQPACRLRCGSHLAVRYRSPEPQRPVVSVALASWRSSPYFRKISPTSPA